MPLLGRGSWVPIQHNVAWAETYLCTKWHLDPSSRLATIDTGRKLGAVPPFWGELGPHLTQSPGPRPTSNPSGILIHPAIGPQWTWAENWGALPLLGRSWVPSNTMWPGSRPTSMRMLSFILIHPTICPQYTNVTDRTGQWSDSTVRTVFTNGRTKNYTKSCFLRPWNISNRQVAGASLQTPLVELTALPQPP